MVRHLQRGGRSLVGCSLLNNNILDESCDLFFSRKFENCHLHTSLSITTYTHRLEHLIVVTHAFDGARSLMEKFPIQFHTCNRFKIKYSKRYNNLPSLNATSIHNCFHRCGPSCRIWSIHSQIIVFRTVKIEEETTERSNLAAVVFCKLLFCNRFCSKCLHVIFVFVSSVSCTFRFLLQLHSSEFRFLQVAWHTNFVGENWNEKKEKIQK